MIDIYSKKQIKSVTKSLNKAAVKEIKNSGRLYNQKIETSNFKQPILIFENINQHFNQTKSKNEDLKKIKGILSIFTIKIIII